MRVRCRCGRMASTEHACKVCGSDHPMRHWHGDDPFDESKTHAHPHDGEGHDHLLIEQYGRKDDALEDFLARIEEAGYNRAHAVAYIQWGLISFFLQRGPRSPIPDIVIDPQPTQEEHDALKKYLEENYAWGDR